MKSKIKVLIRWMIRRDMEEVMKIEEANFPYSWVEEDFLNCLRQRNCIGMVAEAVPTTMKPVVDGGPQDCFPVLGFIIYELHKRSLRVLNLGVHPNFRRNMIGTQILDKMKSKLSGHRRSQLKLYTREGNLSAHLFLNSQGFQATSVKRNFYEDSGEDAYAFQYHMPSMAPAEVAVEQEMI